jgi:HlyD family secretion protein
LKAAQAASESNVKRAQLAQTEAERALDRDRVLEQKGAVTQEQLKAEQSRLDLAHVDGEQAKAALERAHLDLQRAQDALQRARVKAPIGGTVVAVGVEVGTLVSPASGFSTSEASNPFSGGAVGPQPPVVIADLSALMVKLDVDELDVGAVRPGQHVRLRAQGQKDFEFGGSVSRVGLMGREQTGAVLFVVEVSVEETTSTSTQHKASAATATNNEATQVKAPLPPPRELLRPGMSTQAEIEVQRYEAVEVIPVAAVLEGERHGEAPRADRVFVIDEKRQGAAEAVTRAHAVEVKLGPAEGDVVSVLRGLVVGQRVVEGPYRALRELKDGDSVTLDGAAASHGTTP